MDTVTIQQNNYDQYAAQYAQSQKRSAEGEFSWNHDLVIPNLLQVLGNIAGLSVLDAGCGEGVLSRYLAGCGAHVVGVDISQRLVEFAKAQDHRITYHVHDLSTPLPEYHQTFDLVASNLVLNDVPDYQSFAKTIGQVTKVQGRAIFSLTNPYSAVMREKVYSYFESGHAIVNNWGEIKTYHFHRTMQDYVSAFCAAGFLLKSLTDVQMSEEMVARLPDSNRKLAHFPMYHRYPFFVILEFVKQPT